MNRNIIKVIATSLIIATVSGGTLGYVNEVNANNNETSILIEKKTSNGKIFVLRYMSQYIDEMKYMSLEEFSQVFGDDRYVEAIDDVFVTSNNRGGGKSLSENLSDLSSDEIDDLANQTSDKLPDSLKDEFEKKGFSFSDIVDTCKEIIAIIKDKDKDKSEKEAIKEYLVDKFGIDEGLASVVAFGIVGTLNLLASKTF